MVGHDMIIGNHPNWW